MKTTQELFNEHVDRIRKTIAQEKTDRSPIMLHAGAFLLRHAGGKLAELVTDNLAAEEKIVKSLKSFGDVDCVIGTSGYPPISGAMALSHSRSPGRELPEDMQWQIDERGLMTEEDYDILIEKGWNFFYPDFCKRYLDNALEEMKYYGSIAGEASKKFTDEGVVILTPVMAGTPLAAFSGGRGIPKFMRDLHRIPDKIEAACEAAMVDRMDNLRKQIRDAKPIAVFLGGGRGAGDFLRMKDFDRFMWRFFKQIVDTILEEGADIYFHLDLEWDRFLNYFLEVPKGRAIFHPDSATDIFKAGEVLKDRMAFMGDVSPSLLTLGSPEEVHAYCKRLMDTFVPTGFFMGAGCCVPHNAKPENVQAMMDIVLK